ncbi:MULTISPECIES: 2-keto-4-pentenoate hydratase [unclassified Sphingomonas]|uniref:2-keto-4-pentenoate hydratase n=1 Tax=unclassified Sphingomonas TaxID=196159 RepID=UPI0006F24BFB|nr:2-keto-4-pentenoate hydratase [Sphingomonas sp. Root1294]KQY65721.1 2-keto-4-pentenoate hydratase [Sphingomonas sp. Root50]KRB94974.1 2-keto-4-pentenoate hydratase [Sphingomonas sp. Root720]
MTEAEVEAQAAALRACHAQGAPMAPIRLAFPQATIDDAYAIQARNTAHWLGEGRRAVGAKIGLTARAVQQQLGVDQPDFGMLFADMAVEDGDEVVAGRLLQPKVEAEVAFVMARPLDIGRLTTAELIDAVAFVLPALEIVDSRIAGWDIGIVDTVADNASSGLFVLGTEPHPLDDLDLKLCGMVLEKNGEQVSFGAGAACLGHPLHALAWLARTMDRAGHPLGEGDVILSGALGPMVAAGPGDRFEARINGLGRVGMRFAAAA